MNITDAVIEYLRTEIVPLVAKDSALTGGILNGALRSARKKLSGKINSNSQILQALDITDEEGNINVENAREFFDGMFEGSDDIAVSLAEILRTATGLESDAEMLKDKLHFTKSDAEKFLALLTK
jgi:hypothetical protein